jgi:hypothetical protein
MQGNPPLPQLADITLPEPIGLWPLAPGWWLLIALILTALLAGGFFCYRRHQRLAFRRAACCQWQQLAEEIGQPHYVASLNRLLKQTAISAGYGEQVSALSGEAWLAFIAKHSRQAEAFEQGVGQVLASGPYQAAPFNEHDSPEALHQLCGQWLKELKPC